MVARSALERMQKHLDTNLRLYEYRRVRGPALRNGPAAHVVDPQVRGLLQSIRRLRRRHQLRTQHLPSMHD
jgi:hypothetical protein